MKKIKFIDRPVYMDVTKYEKAIMKATDLLSSQPEVATIYQIGGISSPGISDIDMVVVFKNGMTSGFSLLEHLNPEERYLFIHRVYGISEEQFLEPLASGFFHNYKLLFGRDLLKGVNKNIADENVVRKQVAYEFLLKMYMVMTVQRAYGIVKTRAFLLEAHALKYDLDLLNIVNGNFYDAVQEVIKLRADWFDIHDGENRVQQVFEKLYDALCKTLEAAANSGAIFLPEKKTLRAGNLIIQKGSKFGMKRSGLLLPQFFKDKKHFNLLHRFNRFKFTIPYNQTAIPEAIKVRFALTETLRKYNLIHLPDFLPLVSSLRFD